MMKGAVDIFICLLQTTDISFILQINSKNNKARAIEPEFVLELCHSLVL